MNNLTFSCTTRHSFMLGIQHRILMIMQKEELITIHIWVLGFGWFDVGVGKKSTMILKDLE